MKKNLLPHPSLAYTYFTAFFHTKCLELLSVSINYLCSLILTLLLLQKCSYQSHQHPCCLIFLSFSATSNTVNHSLFLKSTVFWACMTAPFFGLLLLFSDTTAVFFSVKCLNWCALRHNP